MVQEQELVVEATGVDNEADVEARVGTCKQTVLILSDCDRVLSEKSHILYLGKCGCIDGTSKHVISKSLTETCNGDD